jgi:hypothetical protein
MNINSIPGANIAASVWTNATRTLTDAAAVWAQAARTLTDAAVVWAQATRTLTADPNPFTDVTANGVALAAAAVLDLRPAAGKRRLVTMMAGNASMVLGSYDGATFTQVSTINAFNTLSVASCNAAQCMTIKNTSGGSLNYWYSGWDRG